MAAQDQDKTRIDADGLHYRAKAAGSVFNKPGQASFSNKTMSCFRCGAHKLLADLATKKILGRNEKVCAVDCRSKA